MSRLNLLQRWRERRRQKAIQALQEETDLSIRRWSMEELTPWLEHQLAPLLEQQTQMSHERSVWRFVVQMLIASHPIPELLQRNWEANLPNVVDELHEHLPKGDERFRELALEAWKQELRRFATLIEQTVQARRAAEQGR